MTLYVESNFVLEIALGQEDSESAEQLLVLAEKEGVHIAIPSFAVSEPFSTVTGRKRQRGRLLSQFNREMDQLDRFAPHQRDVASLRQIPDVVAQINGREADRLADTTERLLSICRLVHLDMQIFKQASVYQGLCGLETEDSIILASVVTDLRMIGDAGPHYFANKNSKDFALPEIADLLRTFQCSLVTDFAETLSLLRSH